VSRHGHPDPGDGVPERIVAAIRDHTDIEPLAGIVLGSGLGETATVAKDAAGSSPGLELAYTDLPGFPPPTVQGHAGRLWLGELGGRPVAIFQGRIHFYEGHGMPLASITSRVAALLGAATMVLTTAAGAIDSGLVRGSIVVIRDHINFMGTNPLTGWRMPDGSPAFVDVADTYDATLSDTAIETARAATGSGDGGTSIVAEGVYGAVAGPSYETGAETEMMRRAGATVVGMSMVPEAVAAHALDMRVLGLSFVTNAAGETVSHEDVLIASRSAAEVIGRVVAGVMDRMPLEQEGSEHA
jgi:purine-nucleoside phosphorylase